MLFPRFFPPAVLLSIGFSALLVLIEDSPENQDGLGRSVAAGLGVGASSKMARRITREVLAEMGRKVNVVMTVSDVLINGRAILKHCL